MMKSNKCVCVTIENIMICSALIIAAVLCPSKSVVDAFTSPLFQIATANQKLVPSKIAGADVELPDFDELFSRIQQVSPLARQVIQSGGNVDHDGGKGFDNIEEQGELKWKKVESNKKKTVHHIDKIENFQNNKAPILRFRASMKGPCLGAPFSDFIMSYDERRKWDPQINKVDELYSIEDLVSVQEVLDMEKYGDCSKIGVGYCQTKANLGISPREQLTLCGVQDFDDGSCVIWGVEMPSWHDHLLPEGTRHTRAKSHIFCTTLTPTGDDTFDVEYVLQMDAGGNLPGWLTTSVMVDTVKNLFKHAESYYAGGEGSDLQKYMLEKASRQSELAARIAENDVRIEAKENQNEELVEILHDMPVGLASAAHSVFLSVLEKGRKSPLVSIYQRCSNKVKSFVRRKLRFVNA